MRTLHWIKTPIFLLALLLFTVASYGESTPTSDAVFLTHMRTLSESRGLVWRAYKNYIMLGLKNPYKNPSERLSKSITLFEKSIDTAYAYTKEKNLSKTLPFLDQALQEWHMLKTLLLDAPSPAQVARIDTLAMKVTRTIIKALKAMGSYDASDNWKYLEQIQKAQNIAQRMGTLYLDNVWGGLSAKRYDKMMTKVTGNYTKVENLIYKSQFLTPEIEETLQHAHKDYFYFEMMWKSGKHVRIPTLIYKKSSDMDQKLGHCTTLIMQALSK